MDTDRRVNPSTSLPGMAKSTTWAVIAAIVASGAISNAAATTLR